MNFPDTRRADCCYQLSKNQVFTIAILVRMIEDAIDHRGLQALIARSADFYGTGANASIWKIGVIDTLLKNKKAFWQADDGKIHSLTYTPDTAKAVALLGNTPDAYRQTWHLPTSKEKITGKELIALTASAMKEKCAALSPWQNDDQPGGNFYTHSAG